MPHLVADRVPSPPHGQPRRRGRGARRSLVIRRLLVRLAFRLARTLPVRRRVVLATSHAREISGNLAFIRDELLRGPARVPVVVRAHRPERGLRGRAKGVLDALVDGYHLATARLFVVDDYFFPMYCISPRRRTWRAQVWHASGAFKKFGYSVLDKTFGATEATLSLIAIHSNYDLCLVSSVNVAPHYAEAFGQPLRKFVSHLGIPRTDTLFAPDVPGRIDAVRRRYGLGDGRRVILFAPTFRGNNVIDARYAEDLDFEAMRSVLGESHRVLLRLHPFVRNRVRTPPELADFVVDASQHPDIHDLMLASDLLVTDYSSAIYEYSLLGRPILFFAPDREAYEDERGFYFDYESGVPGPIFDTTSALAEFIGAGRFDTDRVREFAAASFDVADGQATRRFVDQVVRPAMANDHGWLERVLRRQAELARGSPASGSRQGGG